MTDPAEEQSRTMAKEWASSAAALSALALAPDTEQLAVLATFDPDRIKTEPGRRLLCDELANRDGRREWMLKESHRVQILTRLLQTGGRGRLRSIRAVAQGGYDGPLQHLLDVAIDGRELDITELTEDELVAALHVGRWCTSAGAAARQQFLPSGFEREPIEGLLAQLDIVRPLQDITADGCVGRQRELSQLRRYTLQDAVGRSLLELPPQLVYGIGGVGKSTLVAQFVLDLAADQHQTAWVYLDLDRPTLSSYDPATILTDIIRQVGTQIPQAQRYLARSGSTVSESSHGFGIDSEYRESWRAVLPQLASAVNSLRDGRLLVILDTFEELQRAENSQDVALFDMFLALSVQTDRFRLVVSGRAPAAPFIVPNAADQMLRVDEFRGTTAIEVLDHLYQGEATHARPPTPSPTPQLNPSLAAQVVDTVGGSPLTLRLAARVLVEDGAAGVTDAASRGGVLGRVRQEFIRGFLYNRILDHLFGTLRQTTATGPGGSSQFTRRSDLRERDALRLAAKASLALRYLTEDLMASVLLPAANVTGVEPAVLMADLRVEKGFVEVDGNRLRLREELRGPALRAVGFEAPDMVADVHRRAAQYYAQWPDLPGSAAERVYHLLALGRPIEGFEPGQLALSALRGLERSFADFPDVTREQLQSALDDDHELDDALEQRRWEVGVEWRAQLALDAARYEEAADLLAERTGRSTATTLHRLDAALYESIGDVDRARSVARLDVNAAAASGDAVRYAAAVARCALLEERTVGGFSGAEVFRAADDVPLLSGQPALRLELHLHRMAMLERAGLDEDTWLLDLDARALLQRVRPDVLRNTTALTRLLAATLGRDEPSLIRAAAREMGLGTTNYSAYVDSLVTAIATWDGQQEHPGSLAAAIGITTDGSASSLERAWYQAIGGLGPQSGTVLDSLWVRGEPPAAVLEPLRTIYLWWGLDPNPTFPRPPGQPPIGQPSWSAGPDTAPGTDPTVHFLDGELDFSDPTLQQFALSISGAYPRLQDLEGLASTTDLDFSAISWKQRPEALARDLIVTASQEGKLDSFVREVVNEQSSSPFGAEIVDLIGKTWLDQKGIHG